jgi:hypothetical protein
VVGCSQGQGRTQEIANDLLKIKFINEQQRKKATQEETQSSARNTAPGSVGSSPGIPGASVGVEQKSRLQCPVPRAEPCCTTSTCFRRVGNTTTPTHRLWLSAYMKFRLQLCNSSISTAKGIIQLGNEATLAFLYHSRTSMITLAC